MPLIRVSDIFMSKSNLKSFPYTSNASASWWRICCNCDKVISIWTTALSIFGLTEHQYLSADFLKIIYVSAPPSGSPLDMTNVFSPCGFYTMLSDKLSVYIIFSVKCCLCLFCLVGPFFFPFRSGHYHNPFLPGILDFFHLIGLFSSAMLRQFSPLFLSHYL